MVGLFVALRTQEGVRYLRRDLKQEIGVFLTHVTWFLLACAGAAISFGLHWEKLGVMGAFWLSLVLGAALQAARNGSAFSAFAGVVVWLGATVLSVLAIDGLSQVLKLGKASGRTQDYLYSVIFCLVSMAAAALVILNARLEGRPLLRRIVLSASLVSASVFSLAFMIITAPKDSDFTAIKMAASAVIGIAAVILSLRLSDRVRRALMYTVK